MNMLTKARLAAGAGLCSLLVFASSATADMLAVANIGGESIDIPLTLVDAELGIYEAEYHEERAGDWKVDIEALLDPDPQIVYSFHFVDFGSPSSFSFTLSQPIVPTSAPGIVSHDHASSTSAGGGAGDTTPVTALAPPAGIPDDGDGTDEVAVYTLSTDGGTTWINPGLDLNPSFVGAGPSDTQGPFAEGPIAGPAAAGEFYDAMRVDVNVEMDGGNDVFSFNGRAFVIPEPSSLALLLAAVVGLVGCTRRRSA